MHPANQGRQGAAIFGYLGWQLSKRLLGTRHRDIRFHGLTLRCHADSHSASAAMYFNGLPDYREMCFIQRYLRPGDAFLDVGANVGVYTLLAAALVGAQGRVDAFEPGAKARSYLSQNVAQNGLSQVWIHPLALSDHAGVRAMLQTGDDCTACLAVNPVAAGQSATQVNCVTLDAFAPDAHWAMAKLDVEGAEALVLGGASAHLARHNPPVLQIEMDGHSKRFGVSTDAFIKRLGELAYRTASFDPASGRIESCERPWEQGIRNVLAIHQDSWTRVQARLQDPVG